MKFALILFILTTFSGCITSGPTPSPSPFSFTPHSSSQIAAHAKRWENKHYKRGQTHRCADFVATVVSDSGGQTKAPEGYTMARSWLKFGKPVSRAMMRPGDVIVFWRGSRRGTSGHIGIFIGNGEMIHRSTYRAPVKRTAIDTYNHRILGIRRG